MRADRNSLAHLRLANDVRSRRAELKRQLADGETTIVRVLADPPWFCRRMEVAALLAAAPWFSRAKAERVMRRAGIAPLAKLERLNQRQRMAIVSSLSHLHPHVWRRWEAVVA